MKIPLGSNLPCKDFTVCWFQWSLSPPRLQMESALNEGLYPDSVLCSPSMQQDPEPTGHEVATEGN